MYREFGISDETLKLAADCEAGLRDIFAEADRIAEYNQLKVLHAMQKNRVSEECFRTSTGYGHNDYGRDTLERVYADVFRTENALVRPQITCGTHAIATALFAVLRPGDELLCPAGRPYDTLHEVIGIRDSAGSLKEYGVSYREVGLKEDGSFDYDAIRAAVNDKTKLVEIQRSRGYSERRSFSVAEIGELIRFIKDIRSDILVMVDNCYGEFTEVSEPSEAGADMVARSVKEVGVGFLFAKEFHPAMRFAAPVRRPRCFRAGCATRHPPWFCAAAFLRRKHAGITCGRGGRGGLHVRRRGCRGRGRRRRGRSIR